MLLRWCMMVLRARDLHQFMGCYGVLASLDIMYLHITLSEQMSAPSTIQTHDANNKP